MKDQTNCSQNILAKTLEQFVVQGRRKFYLSDVTRESGISLNEVEDFFLPLLKEKQVEGYLEVRCPNCGAELGIYGRHQDIPKSISCEVCCTEFPRTSEDLEIVLEIKGKFFRDPKESTRTNWKEINQR